MRILYIDTSSSYLYTSIVENDKVLSEIKEEFGQSLSEVALPRIVSMFEDNNLSPKDIDKIIVVNGPGSFTGIRIGITIAKIYAWSLNIPITTIYSLEAMAISSNKEKYHVPIINARRGYVYAAIYDKDYNEILKENNEIIGYIYYSDIYERCEINQFEIMLSERNSGKGDLLLKYLINLVKKDITLEVKEDNTPAIKVYLKNGFQKTAIREGYYNGVDGILMERKYKDSLK